MKSTVINETFQRDNPCKFHLLLRDDPINHLLCLCCSFFGFLAWLDWFYVNVIYRERDSYPGIYVNQRIFLIVSC